MDRCKECGKKLRKRKEGLAGRKPMFCGQKCANRNWCRAHPRVTKEAIQ